MNQPVEHQDGWRTTQKRFCSRQRWVARGTVDGAKQLSGRGESGRSARYRARLRANGIRIFADAHVKHGTHAIVADRPVEELVKDLVFFDADAIIATGQPTGHAVDLSNIRMIKEAAGLRALVGSGVTPDNANDILGIVDGVIIASALKHDGVWWNQVDPAR